MDGNDPIKEEPCKEPIKEEPCIEPIKEVQQVEIPYYEQYNALICRERGKKMLFYKSEDFCNLLYQVLDPNENELRINSYKSNICPNDTGNHIDVYFNQVTGIISNGDDILFNIEDSKVNLNGYYIEPQNGRFNGQVEIVGERVHFLKFYPAWLIENNTHFIEVISGPIQIPLAAISTNMGIPNFQAHIFANDVNSPADSFNHNDLQFDYLRPFNKSFISRHELFLIVQHAEYIGITGSRVSTGNFTISENDVNNLNLHGCNKNYFTYRFIGFNEVENVSGLRAFNLSNSENGQVFSPAIPNETWSVPCPPSWIPF